jgi:hypothetical protein
VPAMPYALRAWASKTSNVAGAIERGLAVCPNANPTDTESAIVAALVSVVAPAAALLRRALRKVQAKSIRRKSDPITQWQEPGGVMR